MSKRVIRGKFYYEDEESKKKKSKKERRKEELKALKIKDKEIAKQCECNHLDRKHNKTHMKKSDDGNYNICKICGGRLIANPDLLTEEAVKAACDTLYTVLGLTRNRLSVSEEMDEAITNALKINSRAPELLKLIKEDHFESNKKHKKKNGKKKNKKKGGNNHFRRAFY